MKKNTWKQLLCTMNILESHLFLEVLIGPKQDETLSLRLATWRIQKEIVSFGLKLTKVIGKNKETDLITSFLS